MDDVRSYSSRHSNPLTLDLAENLGLALPLVKAEAYVGLIEYGPKGLLFNNALIKSQQLGPLCDKNGLLN
jgi:hypothetical protein